MVQDKCSERLTLSKAFLEPANSNHRQYEALRAFFIEGLPSAEAATRFGYTPGSFRVLVHHFRKHPDRSFFLPPAHEDKPRGQRKIVREQVMALRKQSLSIYDISRALARRNEAQSPGDISNPQTGGFFQIATALRR